MRETRVALWAAVAAPLLYYATLFGSALLYPGYSHVTQYASELGASDAPHPMVFNIGVMLTGVATVVGAVGLRRAALDLGARAILTTLGAIALAAFGLAMVLGGVFPMPDPRHGAWGLGFAIALAPPLFAAAVWDRMRGLGWAMLAVTVVLLALLAVMMGVGGLVRRANVGLWQRAFSLAIYPWMGVVALWFRARFRERAPAVD